MTNNAAARRTTLTEALDITDSDVVVFTTLDGWREGPGVAVTPTGVAIAISERSEAGMACVYRQVHDTFLTDVGTLDIRPRAC